MFNIFGYLVPLAKQHNLFYLPGDLLSERFCKLIIMRKIHLFFVAQGIFYSWVLEILGRNRLNFHESWKSITVCYATVLFGCWLDNLAEGRKQTSWLLYLCVAWELFIFALTSFDQKSYLGSLFRIVKLRAVFCSYVLFVCENTL